MRGSELAPTGHIPQASYFPPALSLSFPTCLQGGNDYHRFKEQCSVVPQAAWLISVEQRQKAGCAKPLPSVSPEANYAKQGRVEVLLRKGVGLLLAWEEGG